MHYYYNDRVFIIIYSKIGLEEFSKLLAWPHQVTIQQTASSLSPDDTGEPKVS